nr:snRNA-activating protein complex subunit 1-like [Lytechinus pictus]
MGRIPKKPHEVLFDGLQTDLKGLLMRFISTESVRYEEFTKIWRALNFPVIFYGIKNDEQLRTFTSEAFAMSASSLVPPHDLQTRICSMYMLYALYHTQLCTPKLKLQEKVLRRFVGLVITTIAIIIDQK